MAGLLADLFDSVLSGSRTDTDWTQNIQWAPLQPVNKLREIQPKIVFCSHHYNTPIVHTIKWDTDEKKFASEFVKDLKKYTRNGKLIFITHGFMSGSSANWMNELRRELIKNNVNNVIGILDWSQGAKQTTDLTSYIKAAANCLTVGEWLGEHAKALKRELGSQFEIWGVGHSLGSHLMGKAGDTSSGAFTRITGLDPAGPGFASGASGYRHLMSNDATKMVDVIHTDGGVVPPYFGTLIPFGTIDFYPDFGLQKPSNAGLLGMLPGNITAHELAHVYYIWSIQNPGKFETQQILDEDTSCVRSRKLLVKKAKLAPRKAEMGFHADKGEEKYGHYYLATNDSEPWAPKEEKSWYNIF